MALRMRSDPDCNGMWRLGMTCGVVAMASMTSPVNAAG